MSASKTEEAEATNGAAGWTAGLTAAAIPERVLARAQDLLLDTLGVAVGAARTPAAAIAYDFAADHFAARPGGDTARLPFDGRATGIPGAAWALATRIDNLDAHDGFQPVKGHAGVVLVATLLALVQSTRGTVSGRDALAALVAGYEVASRAGLTLHHTAADYHSSGAWNALGAAALGARLQLPDDAAATAHALGIAEYHAPRAPMMREIDQPSMLHDSSGWGAMAGVTGVLLAARGFAASRAALTAGEAWDDLGTRWLVEEQYTKPHPVCFWAQPAVRAALALRERHKLGASDIAGVRVETFHEATRLATGVPPTTAAAQYALAFPVACALARGRVGPDEIAGSGLSDATVATLTARIEASERVAFSARFPAERTAEVVITTADGTRLRSGPHQPHGVPDSPLTRGAIETKFREYTADILSPEATAAITAAVLRLHEPDATLATLLEACLAPAPAAERG